MVAALAMAGAAFAQNGADIVVLGEVHDNAAHHRTQAEMIAALQPAAIVFEMLRPDQVAAAQGVARDDAEAMDAAMGWTGSGWPDFEIYHPLFIAAPDAEIFGAALPLEEVRRAMTDGAAEVFGSEAGAYGLGALDAAAQEAREAEQMAAHCNALPEAMLPGMVEAQRLRDAHFARVALEALEITGGPVVVITGNGHARKDIGIPAYIAVARPEVSVYALGQLEARPTGDEPFDAVTEADAPPREDPCGVFE